MSLNKAKMDDLDDIVQEIDGLPDDLYLDDVGGDKPGKKYVDWVSSRNGRSSVARGRGRPKKRRFVDSVEDDLLGLDEHDLNALENWDLGDEELYALELEAGVSKKPGFRSRSVRGRPFVKRGQFKRGSGAGQRQFRSESFESPKPPEDVFDIESKSHHRRFNWSRVGGFVQDEASRKSGESAEQEEPASPSYMAPRKDTRLVRQVSDSTENRFGPSRNDPRLKMPSVPSTSTSENVYAPARKDPRLVPQQALAQRQQTSKPRNDPRFKPFEPRFVQKKDPRLVSEKIPGMELGPPGVEEMEDAREQVPVTRRGPRSPSPPSPLRISGDRSQSPSSRRSRLQRDRSLSPRRHNVRHDSLSPHRQEWRSNSRDHGSPSRSPGRRMRRDRSLSPRGRHRHSREFSGSPRRDHTRDESSSSRRERSLSPRGRLSPFSPYRRSSLSSSRDEPWRRSPGRLSHVPHYSHVQQPPAPQQSYEVIAPPPLPTNVYSESNYSGSTPAAPTYSAPQAPPPAYSNYQQYGYDNYYQQPPPPPSYSGEYVPPAPQPPSWSDGGMVYPDVSQPPPVQMAPASGTGAPSTLAVGSSQSSVDQKSEEAKKEAVKNEMIQQKQTLSKQREEYVRKKALIARELELLREQEEELLEENSRDNDRILKENHKLQLEIQNKLKAINNVIDMLTGIIGDKEQLMGKATHKEPDKKKPKTPPETPPQSSSSESEHMNMVVQAEGQKPVCNYVHYDPEMHWCRVCDVFPRTAKEYLNHLHSIEHKEETLERKLVDMPWHKIQLDQEVIHIPGAPTKRTPIRGLQFFISATAWYCKLCDTWIGDLHCASLHLKSKRHSENYANFTHQNPHWETDWLADRERAYERCSEERLRLKEESLLPPGTERTLAQSSAIVYSQDFKVELKDEKLKKKMISKEQRRKLKKTCVTALDETKKKKRRKKKKKKLPHEGRSSSSGSSNSSNSSSEGGSEAENEDKSKSIRVAMRNKIKGVQEPIPLLPRSRWDSPPEEKLEDTEGIKQPINISTGATSGDDKLIREWMTTSKEVSDGEKQLLNSIKDRLRQKQEADRERERERRDDKRDSRRGRRLSESPSSPSYRTKRSRSDKSPDDRRERSSRFDRYERHDPSQKSPERSTRRDSSSKVEQKLKEEAEVKTADKKKVLPKLVEEYEDDDEESAESKFEKQTAESAAKLMKKAKKPAVMAIPKSKLPFIGRMPILKHFAKKKKPEENKLESSDKKEAPEDPLVQAQYKLEFTNVGGKVHIGPQEPSKSKGSGVIGPELPSASTLEVQDMDIDEDTSNSDVAPPVIDTPAAVDVAQSPSPKKPLTDIPLPKDFQDALNILFPGQESSEKKEEICTSSSGVIQSGPKPPSVPQQQQSHWPPGAPGPAMMPPMQNYGGSPMMGVGGGPRMMPAPMHGMHGPHPYGPPFRMPMMGPPMMPKNDPPVRPPPPPPPNEQKKEETPPKKEMPTRKSDVAGEMSADELAMMGIDVGDMAAQSF